MRRYGLPLILIFSILPYLPIFWNGFVGDDVFRIVQNPEIGELSLFQLLQRPLYPGDIFRPVMIFLQAAIIKSCGMSAFPLHLLSVLLHAANGVLVLTLLRRFLKYPLALASTLVFAVHPLHSEAVANISAQSVLLMSFFCFLSLVLTLGDRCTSFTRLALLFFTSLLAFGSKESGFALFVLIPVFLSWSARTERIPKALTVLLSSASFYMLGRISALGSSDFFGGNVSPLDNPMVTLSFFDRIPYVMANLGNYIFLHLVPFPLRSDYSYAFKTVDPMHVASLPFLHALLFLLFVLLLLRAFVAKKETRVWYYWFLGSFVVTANFFFPIGTVFAERLAYLPSLGIIVLVLVSMQKLISEKRRTFFLCVCLAFFSYLTVVRCFDWYDNYTLVAHEYAVTPQSAKNQYHFGVYLEHVGDLQAAQEHFLEAYLLFPRFVEPVHALAMNAFKRHDSKAMEWWLERAYEINPGYMLSLLHLGILRAQQGNFDTALDLLSRAHMVNPRSFDVKLALLGVYINLRKNDAAKTLLSHLQREQPNNEHLKRYQQALLNFEN